MATREQIDAAWRHNHFSCFARNGRWGTCVDCPKNMCIFYPEFCENTKREDHNLSLDSLIEQYKLRVNR